MLDPFGHYDGLLAWLRGLVESGYVAPGAMDRLVIVDDVDAALDGMCPGASDGDPGYAAPNRTAGGRIT